MAEAIGVLTVCLLMFIPTMPLGDLQPRQQRTLQTPLSVHFKQDCKKAAAIMFLVWQGTLQSKTVVQYATFTSVPAYGIHSLIQMIVYMVEVIRTRLVAFLLATCSSDDPVTATGNFIHPYDVEHIQTYAGDNPGHLCTQAKPLEGGRTKRAKHLRPVWRHHSDAHQEEGHSHGHTIGHH